MQKISPHPKSYWLRLGIIVLLVLLVKCVINFSASIEEWYATGIYKYISRVLRFLFGWLSFSIGDVFYTILIVAFLVKVFRFFRDLVHRRITWKIFGMKLAKLGAALCVLYIIFYSFWGWNYYRKGIAYQLQIKKQPYSTQELQQLTKELAVKASNYRKGLSPERFNIPHKELFQKATLAYDSVSKVYSFLQYKNQSVKSSLFGVMGNYLGYTGYYNPFSGEAQINTVTPSIVLPSVTCHEMAHQLGYATEDEANFVGYLAASHSHDTVFLYSVYLDMYQYAASELFVRDSIQYNQARQSLDTLVRKDLRDIRLFYLPYRTKVRKVVNMIYGEYLRSNNQPQGIDTYSDVISLLMAYRKKYGVI